MGIVRLDKSIFQGCDQILNLRIPLEKAHEHQQSVLLCFVSLCKASESASHERLWFLMLDMGDPPHLVYLAS